MKILRRDLLKYSSATGFGLLSSGCSVFNVDKRLDLASPSALKANLIHYDLLGPHRTGSAGDEATINWLFQFIGAYTRDIRLDSYVFNKIDHYMVELDGGDDQYTAMPLFDSVSAGAKFIEGRVGFVGDICDIVLLKSPPHYSLPGGDALLALRNQHNHKAIVVVTDGQHIGFKPGLSPINASYYEKPLAPPVLQLSSTVWPQVSSLAKSRQLITVNMDIDYKESRSSNIVATIKGSNTLLKPLVVMTPLTGWWHCASERGGGIAIWLELIKYVATLNLERTIIFLGSTGHELGHLGLKSVLASGALSSVHAYLHIGAAFCGHNAFLHLQTSSDSLSVQASHIMKTYGIQVNKASSAPDSVVGEIKDVISTGVPYISLSGVNPWFHNKLDRWYESVNFTKAADMSRIFKHWLHVLNKI